MRKPELAAAIAEETGLTKEKSNEVITVITDQIAKTLSEGDTVALIGFGTLAVVHALNARAKTHKRVLS